MQSGGLGALLDAEPDTGPALARLLGGFALAVSLALLLAVALPSVLLGRVLPSPAQPITEAPRVEPAGPRARSAAVDVARRYLGVPYVFGGTDPRIGLDCSGLVQLVFRQLGIGLPRTAQQQFDATPRIARDQLQPGDLVFFARTYADPNAWITHVGIYVGDGQHINAPTTGQVVSIQPLFSGYWGAHYAGAGRVPGARAALHSGGSET